jgi:CRP-like cAMP-binding protein
MSKFTMFGGKSKTGKALREEAGRVLLDGDYAQALQLFTQLHEESPDDVRILAKVAELREKTGDVSGAVTDYCRVAEAYAAQGFVVQAIAISKIILRLDPGKTEIQEKLRKLSDERSGGSGSFGFSGKVSTEAEQMRAGLANTPLLSGMSGEQLGSFIDSLTLRHVDAGEEIYQTGDSGEYLYLIGMGQVALQAIDTQGRKQVFSHLKEGDFFGERAFMARMEQKGDAIAETECSILMVDRNTFDNWVEQYPEMRATVEEFYRQRVLARLLTITPVFEGVPAEARMALTEQFSLRTFENGEVIMKQGEISDGFYLIRSGSVALAAVGPSGEQMFHASLGEGEFFGEVALLTGRPRTATVVANGAVELMALSRTDFERITEEYPSIRQVVQDYLRRRAEETIRALRQQSGKA